MIALLQRVNYAGVTVSGNTIARIDRGILAFIGYEKGDTREMSHKMFDRILRYRIFGDENDKMNLSVSDIGGRVLLVSQFTLAAETSRGNRPGFDPAMPPEEAREMYEDLVSYARIKAPGTESGEFGADMKVALENDGPVTFLLRLDPPR